MKKKENNPLFLSNYLFFIIEKGCILVWDYKYHNQYLLEKDYFFALLKISENDINKCKTIDEKILKDLVESKLISLESEQTDWEWDILSRIFHIGTQNVCEQISELNQNFFTENYINKCKELNTTLPTFFLQRKGVLIDLPQPNTTDIENVSFYSVIKNRKTCRNFNAEFITLENLSLILHCSFGLIHGKWEEFERYNLEKTAIRKSSPSGGGLHSEEIYVVAYRVENLTAGLYHYRPYDHKLAVLAKNNFEQKVIEMNYKQFFSEGMAFGIYITSRLDRIWWKYKHSRAYKGMLLDIGHLSQTFLLSSTALGLQTWLTGAFFDSQVEEFLTIDGKIETIILFVGAGKGNNQSLPTQITL